MAEDFEDAGQRYAFLLRPVKDLSKNFEIDIAKELDDYCQQLRSAAENEEYGVDNQHRFNFAEAAMLIQGSAFVFGRKVDYVHSQAIHFFEALQPQKSKKRKRAAGDEYDEGFVDDNGDPLDPCDLLDFSNVKCCSLSSLYKDHHKSKFKGNPPKITVMPMSLMPLSDEEKNGVLIYSTGYRKEIVGKMDDFKMNAGFLNNDGVLLLHLAHNKIVNDFASEAFLRLWHPHLFAKSEEPKTDSTDLQLNDPDSGRGTPTKNVENTVRIRSSSPMEIARRTTCSTDLLSARPSTCLLDVPNTQSQNMDVDNGRSDGGASCYSDDFDTAASMHIPDDVHSRRSRMQQQQQPQLPPWEAADSDLENDPIEKMLLDPFSNSQWKRKPVETIERFIRATVIAKRLEKAENSALTFRRQTMQTNDYVKEHFYMRKKHKTCKGDDWQADALYRFIIAVMKKRAEAKRERKAKTHLAMEAVYYDDQDDEGNIDDDDDFEQENDENVPPKTNAADANTAAKDSEREVTVAEAQRAVSAKPLRFGDIEDDDLQNSIDINSLYGGYQPSGETQTSCVYHSHTKKHSFLAILREHMLKFWSTTEEVTSELVTRVQDWEDTMVPILEEEETRKEFDIHEYGDELLRMFKEVGEVKTIDELMEGRKPYEISRYFLACLMMANTYNVKVDDEVRADGSGQQLNTMKVTLLKRDRHHEVFDQAGAL